jgi:hypothetical protein
MRRFSKRKLILLSPLFLIAFAAFLFLIGWVVMLLWNAVLVPAVGAGVITFWQGLGLLALSRLLVGGFSGRRNRRGNYWKDKWENMSDEKKEAIKEKLKQKFEGRFSSTHDEDRASSSNREEGD